MDTSELSVSLAGLLKKLAAASSAVPTDGFSGPTARDGPTDARVASALLKIAAAVRQPTCSDRVSSVLLLDNAVLSERARSMSVLLQSLRDLSRGTIHAEFNRSKRAALYKLLRSPAPSLLDVVDKHLDENSHSDVLRWLLDPRRAPSVSRGALPLLVAHLPDGTDWRNRVLDALSVDCVTVRREVVLGVEGGDTSDRNRIDLLVTGPTFLVAIENKVTSLEHDGQTPAYWRWLKRRRPLLVGGIFLTPQGLPAQSPEFASVSYTRLLSCLLEGLVTTGITHAEEVILAGYVKTLAYQVLGPELAWFCEQLAGGKK